MDGGANSGDPRPREAAAVSQVCQRTLRIRVHDLDSAERAGLPGQPPVLRVAGRRPDAGARLAAAVVRAVEILLEVGQVAARARVHGSQPTWFLGAAWVSRRSRPLEGDTVLVIRAR